MYMDFSKTIYIRENEFLDGRSIVIFDCNTSFQLTDNNSAKVLTHIIQTFTKGITLSKLHCGRADFA